MANTFSNPIVLDTFTAAIEIKPETTGRPYVPLRIKSIEWVIPTTTTSTCSVTDQNGISLFNEQCVTVNKSIIRYYDGIAVGSIKVAAAAASHMSSGGLAIVLE